jgi:hypothetical protein
MAPGLTTTSGTSRGAADQLRRLRAANRTGLGAVGSVMTTINDLDDFKALDPFFRIIEEGLDGLADGGHFFDLLAEDVVFDFMVATGLPTPTGTSPC